MRRTNRGKDGSAAPLFLEEFNDEIHRQMPCAPACRTRALWGSALIGLAALALPVQQSLAVKPDKPGNTGGGKFTCSIADPGTINRGSPVTFTGPVSGGKSPYTVVWTFPNATPGTVTTPNVPPGNTTAETTFNAAGQQTVLLNATEEGGNGKPKGCSASLQVTVEAAPLRRSHGARRHLRDADRENVDRAEVPSFRRALQRLRYRPGDRREYRQCGSHGGPGRLARRHGSFDADGLKADGSFTYIPGDQRRQRQRQLHLPGRGRRRQPV